MANADVNRVYLWHPALHERIANEQQVFFWLTFDAVFRRARILEGLKTVMERNNIRSYTFWELIGDHDLLLQAWVPRKLHLDVFEEQMSGAVPGGLDSTAMEVTSVVHHWMWKTPDDPDIESVEELVPSDLADLNGPIPAVPPVRIKKYVAANHIVRTPINAGYLFFVRISSARWKGITNENHHQIRERFLEAMQRHHILNGVLLRVTSNQGYYLFYGRVPKSSLTSISKLLNDEALTALLDYVQLRTTTNIAMTMEPLDRREQLRPAGFREVVEQLDIETLLRQPESNELEFKASAFTDIDVLVGKIDRKPQHPTERFRDIAKAVCGMLNADGGIVVVGVVELDRYDEDSLRAKFPDLEVVTPLAAIGTEHEWIKGSWDEYERRIHNWLNKEIDGGIDGWFKIRPARLGVATLCIISVQRPRAWFYVNEKDARNEIQKRFYGRSGGQTKTYSGLDQDRYKDSHPRQNNNPED